MDEMSVFKLKLGEIVRSCAEVKNIAESFEKAAADAMRTKKVSEEATFLAREEYRKLVAQSSEYRTEFDSKKKAEVAQIAKDRAAATQTVALADQKFAEAEKALQSAKEKDRRADERLAEIAKAEVEVSRKKENLHSFISNFK